MPGAAHVDHVEVVFFYDSVQMYVDEVLARGGPPMSEQHVLHISKRQRPLQQRIVVKVDLADRKIIGRAPIRVHPSQQFRGQRLGTHCLGPRVEPSFSTRITDLAIMSSSLVRMI